MLQIDLEQSNVIDKFVTLRMYNLSTLTIQRPTNCVFLLFCRRTFSVFQFFREIFLLFFSFNTNYKLGECSCWLYAYTLSTELWVNEFAKLKERNFFVLFRFGLFPKIKSNFNWMLPYCIDDNRKLLTCSRFLMALLLSLTQPVHSG